MKVSTYENDISTILKGHIFFHDLESEMIDFITNSATIEELDPHEYLFYEGDPASKFYLVLKGLIGIQVFAGNSGFLNIQRLGPGEIIGWSWLLPPYAWFFSGEILKPSHVITFDGETLRNICENNHDFGYAMAKRVTAIVTQRLHETRLKLVEYMD